MKIKLNASLAKTEHLASIFKKSISDYSKFFKSNQGAFLGKRKTYEPNPGQLDIPSERDYKNIQTTVKEKMDWFVKNHSEYFKYLFSQERTNALGSARANVVVDGVTLFEDLTSLELLRLKNIIESKDFVEMLENIPVRSDAEIWTLSTAEEYVGREVYETPLQEGIRKTTVKESYILNDPNIDKLKDTSKYQPVVGTKDTVIELGKFTLQSFSGETTQVVKARILQNRSKLLSAVIEALKIANEAEVVESTITADKVFSFLLK